MYNGYLIKISKGREGHPASEKIRISDKNLMLKHYLKNPTLFKIYGRINNGVLVKNGSA